MAWRDGRSNYKKLALFMASIVLGIAAVVSIQSFSENLKENIALQSKSLMGADFIIDSRHKPNEKVLHIIDSLGGADAREINFSSMCLFPGNEATKLVQIRVFGPVVCRPFHELRHQGPEQGLPHCMLMCSLYPLHRVYVCAGATATTFSN